DGLAANLADTGDHPVGGGVALLIAREQPVLLELGARIEQELEAVPHEHLAFGAQLVAILRVALLDARALGVITLFALAHRAIVRGFPRTGSAPRTPRAAAPSAARRVAPASPRAARDGGDRASPTRRADPGPRALP